MDKKKNRYKEQLINALKRRTKKQHSLKTVATALVITLMVVVFVDQIRVRAQEEQGIAHQNTQIAQDAQQTTQKIYIKEVSTSPQFQYDENSIEIIEGYLKCKKDDHILQWQKGRYQWECRKATKVVFNDLGGSVDVSSSGTIKCKNNNEMLYWNTKKDHWSCGNAGSTITISDIDGVNISQNPTSGDIMYFDGEDWVNESIPSIIDGSFFAQNGNAFGQNALLGTNDDYALVFETNDTERMWITEDGNVGIGTDTPDRLFVVSQEQNAGTVGRIENIGTGIHSNARWEINSDASSFQLLSHGSGRTITRYGLALDGWSEILFKDSPTTGGSNGLIIGSEQDLPIVFANNNLERMRIDAGGNVGIGTDAPSNTLTVDGTFNTTGHSAFGNAAVVDGNTLPFFGGAPLSTTISVAESITATTPGVYAGITNVLELNPSADVLGNMYMSDFNVMTIASSNVQDFGFVVGNATMNIHEGSGMIDSMIGSLVATGNDSTGSIEDLVSVSGSLVNSNVAGSVTNAYGLDSYISNSGAMTNVYGVDIEARTYDSGIMTNVRGINIHTPQTRDTSSMTNIYGLYINDQSGVATNDGFNIYSLGANSVNYFEGNVGIGTETPDNLLTVDGNQNITGHSAFGNRGVIDQAIIPGFPPLTASIVMNVAESFTDMSTEGNAGFGSLIELNPSVAPNPGNMSVASFDVIYTAPGNTQDFGMVGSAGTLASHTGNGDVGNLFSTMNTAENNSTGTVNYAYGDLRGVYNRASGTINHAYGSNSSIYNRDSGSIGDANNYNAFISNYMSGSITNARGMEVDIRNFNTGLITNVYGVDILAPRNYSTGSITNAYGLRIGDHSTVPTNDGFNIYSLGANSVNYFEGNVGIGTLTPTQKLHINGNMRLTGALYDSTNSAGTSGYVLQTTGTGTQWVNTSTLGMVFENASGVVRNTGTNASDDFVFGSPQLAYDGNSDHNARIFFDKSRGAFRAGVTTSTQWDDSNVGNYSIALGDNAIASGLNSVSIGRGTTANNRYATAFGHSTTASGNWTTTFGRNTTASGDYSMAFGSGTTARSGHEVVFGQYEEVYTPNSTTGWDANDSLFVVANGAIPSARSNALTILKNGDIGIGTATPSQRLTVYNGSTTGTYTTSGWVHSSDRNLKTNIEPIENSLEKVLSLENVYFNWKTNPNDNRQIGFIAQDVKEIIPEIVVGNEQDGYGLSYGNMSALLTGAIKEQNINITSNTLQTDTNINTLQQLQTSVDENLATIQGQFVNANDRYINLSLQVDDIENNILALQSEANQQAKLLDELQLTLEQAQEGIDILTHIDTRILTIDPDALLFINDEVLQKAVVDEDGNEAMQDITELTLNGIMTVTTLKTQHIQTNTFAISDDIIDENDGKDVNASSIGTAIIPAGETEIKVNTQAVAEGSRVFVTPKKALNQALAAEDIVWDESFVVKLLELHDADIAFDWFIVGSK